MALADITKKLQELAHENGAKSTTLIAAENIFVEDWVRQKCEFGCWRYATNFTCPPYSPTPEETRKRLKDYRLALLVEFPGRTEIEELRKMNELMHELEREAFLSGLYKAFAYGATICRICGDVCPAGELSNPGKGSKKECVDQRRIRPPMESVGIDVYQTARKAGLEIHVIQDEDEAFKRFGLLLLE